MKYLTILAAICAAFAARVEADTSVDDGVTLAEGEDLYIVVFAWEDLLHPPPDTPLEGLTEDTEAAYEASHSFVCLMVSDEDGNLAATDDCIGWLNGDADEGVPIDLGGPAVEGGNFGFDTTIDIYNGMDQEGMQLSVVAVLPVPDTLAEEVIGDFEDHIDWLESGAVEYQVEPVDTQGTILGNMTWLETLGVLNNDPVPAHLYDETLVTVDTLPSNPLFTNPDAATPDDPVALNCINACFLEDIQLTLIHAGEDASSIIADTLAEQYGLTDIGSGPGLNDDVTHGQVLDVITQEIEDAEEAAQEAADQALDEYFDIFFTPDAIAGG